MPGQHSPSIRGLTNLDLSEYSKKLGIKHFAVYLCETL